jgi:hypothetical protein
MSSKSCRNRTCSGLIVLNLIAIVATIAAFAADSTGQNSVAVLLRNQTNEFSDAGQRGDQATSGKLLDDQVLFSAGDGNVQRDTKFDKSDEVSDLLKRRTQAFLDAGQRRDTKAMRRYLDRNILFMNEDGVLSDWRDFQSGAPAPPPQGISATISISDWALHSSGDIAVTSYTEDQAIRYNGQTLTNKFLTVATWIKRGSEWKLAGSGTTPLHQDPASLALSEDALTEYAGTYSAGPGSTVVISKSGSELVSATNGGKPLPIAAAARDSFFNPGTPAGYVRTRTAFQRDAAGHISGYVNKGLTYTRINASQQGSPVAAPLQPGPLKLRDFVVHDSGDVAVAAFFHDRDTPCYGQVLHQTYRSMETWIKHGSEWKMIASQGQALLQEPSKIEIRSNAWNDYMGTYTVGSSFKVKISREGDALVASTNHDKPILLTPEVRDVFFMPGAPDKMIIFKRDSGDHVIGYMSRQAGRDVTFTKVVQG